MANPLLSPEELLTLQLSHRSLFSSDKHAGLPAMADVARRLLADALSSGDLDLLAPMGKDGGGFLHRWLDFSLPDSDDMRVFIRYKGNLGGRDQSGQTPFMKAADKILLQTDSYGSSVTQPLLDWLKASPSEVDAWDLPGDDKGAGFLLKLALRSNRSSYDVGDLLGRLQTLGVSLSARRNGVAVASQSTDAHFLEQVFEVCAKNKAPGGLDGEGKPDEAVALRQYFVGFTSRSGQRSAMDQLTSRPEWLTLVDADGKPAAWYAIQADPSVLREFVEHARKKSSPHQKEYLGLLNCKDAGGRGLWTYLSCLMHHRTFTEKLLDQLKQLVPLPLGEEPGFLVQALFDVEQSARVTALLSSSHHSRLSLSWPRDEWLADRLKLQGWHVGGAEESQKQMYEKVAEAFLSRPKLTSSFSDAFLKAIPGHTGGSDNSPPSAVINSALVGWVVGSKISELANGRFNWRKSAEALTLPGAQVPMSVARVDKMEKQALKDVQGWRKRSGGGSLVKYDDARVLEFFENLRRLAKVHTINQSLPAVADSRRPAKAPRF